MQLMKISNYIWAIYLIVFPFYFFKQGDPQIADTLGALLVGINFKSIFINVKANKFTLFLFLFVSYTLLVNTTWMLIFGDFLVLKNSIYYVYSFFIMLFICSRINDSNFLKFTMIAIGISLFVQFVLWPFAPDQGVRTRLFFNNPNQLAQWALSLLLIVNVINVVIKPKLVFTLSLSFLCTFFIILSASRSATAGVILFWLFFLIKKRKQMIVFGVGLVLVISTLTISGKLQINLSDFNTINYIIERMTTQNKSYNQGLEGRGFDRIFNYPHHLLVGAGEGQVERFNTNIEIHSTLFNILFCYGIIGFMFFALALWQIVNKFFREVLVMFLVIGIYMHVHMTLRIPLFWITLLFLYKLNEYKAKLQSNELIHN